MWDKAVEMRELGLVGKCLFAFWLREALHSPLRADPKSSGEAVRAVQVK